MRQTNWAVLGPGAISRDFVTGLRSSHHGVLHAVGSSSAERASAFAAEHGAEASGTYDEILARDDVDAVYIGTVHTTHADLAIRALEAGKAVLCEKPASPTADEVDRILDAAARAGRPFVEAFKTRFGPLRRGPPRDPRERRARRARARRGRLRLRRRLRAPEDSSTLRSPAARSSTSGAIRCRSPSRSRERVGCRAPAHALSSQVALLSASGDIVEGVDGHARAEFGIAGVVAALETSIVRELPASAVIRCERGTIELPDAWGGRAESATTMIVRATAPTIASSPCRRSSRWPPRPTRCRSRWPTGVSKRPRSPGRTRARSPRH